MEPKQKVRITKLIVVLLACAGVLQWYRYASGRTLISDARLTVQFRNHRGDFERLQKMMIEDDLKGGIASDYVDDKQLSPARLAEYRALMKKCGVETLVAMSDGRGAARFWVDSQGSVIASRLKGIAYSPEPLIPIVPSLDESCLPDQGGCAVFRHIEEKWWLVREEDR